MGVKIKEWKGAWWVFVNHRGLRKAKRCASKKAAELVAVKLDAALKLGQLDMLEADRRPLPPPVPTFAEYAAQWLEGVGVARLRPATVEQYRLRLRLRLLPTLGPLPLTAITRETVRTLIGKLIQEGNRRSLGRPVARGTVRQALATLSAILSTAEEDGLIPVNPARRLGRYLRDTEALETQEVEVFTRDELRQLLAVAERDWPGYYPFILCLARTGMRLGEALALEWRDIDFTLRVILVRRSRRRGRVSEPKSGKARRVDMSQQLTEALQSLKTLQEAEAALQGTAPPERVFSTASGAPIEESSFRNHIWRPLLRRAGLRYRKPHCLRHTFASLLIEAGEPLTYIQQQLGHHSAAFTLRVYGHLLPRGDRRAVDVLDEVTTRNPCATTGEESELSPRSFEPAVNVQ